MLPFIAAAFVPLLLFAFGVNAQEPVARSPSDTIVADRLPGLELPDDAALEVAGAVIGEITVEGVNIFDPRLEEENNAVFLAANWLHVRTRRETILQQLLVRPGDRYSARLLRESERRLRAAGYLRDAAIRPVAYSDGVVDLRVYTQDVWTLKPGISVGRKGGANSTSIGIQETNLLGLGKTFGFNIASDVDRTSKSLEYHDHQLAGSWWTLDVGYANNSDGRAEKLAMERPFHALDSRWTAGVSGSNDHRIDSTYQLGSVTNQYTTAERLATVFGGRSAGLVNGYATRLTAGFSFEDTQHGAVAQPVASTVPPPGLRLAYPWFGIAWVEDQFQTARNLDQIGKTEDLAMGFNVNARFGYASIALGSDRNAGIFKGGFSKGWQPTETQKVFLSGHAEGRIEGQGLAGALFNLSTRYYLQQSPKFTFFASATIDRGVHMDADQQILLGGDSGLRGYPLRYQSGRGRWLMTVEQRAFSDWYPFRLFNVGAAAFYDMGRTWDGPVESSQGLLRDVGFGLRLGNSRSALGTVVHIDLAFPLDGDASIKKVQFIIEAKRSF